MTARIASKRAMTLVVLAIYSTVATAQTKITAPSNKYPPSEDVKVGREAADEARKQMPIMNDELVSSFISNLGQKLVAVIPPELQHSEFRYTFETVNVRDINAFALPGGPMFVNRGMIEAAAAEGEVVGVMAHELSHVLLRHGTAQAGKAQGFQWGQLGAAIAGAVIGGTAGAVLSQGAQFGLGTYFMKYSREYEKQADILGAQLMARAGYDARDMANMFKTIEKQGGSGPQWMSDHPNPGNRAEYITKEAAALHVDNPIHQSAAFDRVKAHLKDLPKAPTSEEAAKASKRRGGTPSGSGGSSTGNTAPPSGRVDAPSTSYRQFTEGDVFRVSVPSNWTELTSTDTVTFSPSGAYGSQDGQSVFTHGAQFAVQRDETHDLQTATDELIDAFRRGNPRMSRPGNSSNITFAGQRGLQTGVTNISEVNGREETIQLVTAFLPNGNLIYAIFVAPSSDWQTYRPVFQRITGSVRLIN